MKQLATITEQDFDPAGRGVFDEFVVREAARAVLLDATGEVYLMHVGLHGYHKLPGGGIDPGESQQDALLREILEEVGCEAEIVGEIGSIIEYRPAKNHGSRDIKQISHCYLARRIGVQAEPTLTPHETANQMTQVLARSVQHAIELLATDTPDNLSGKFIQKRDLLLLESALPLVAPQQ